jgi:endo-1,4-beta-xylanase
VPLGSARPPLPPPLVRRAVGLATFVVAACAGGAPTNPGTALPTAPTEAVAAPGRLRGQGLAARAAAKGLFFGVATNSGSLRNDSAYAARVVAEANSLTPEWEMKWNALRPTADRFDFDAADAIVAFASAHAMSVHGHTLVWGEALPGWFSATLTPANADSILAAHVGTVVGRYAGRVARWDVVNEAIDPEGGRADGLRDTPWLRLLGPGYVARAFRLAHAADPHAMLVLNDYGLEVDNPWAGPAPRGLAAPPALAAGRRRSGARRGHAGSPRGAPVAGVPATHPHGVPRQRGGARPPGGRHGGRRGRPRVPGRREDARQPGRAHLLGRTRPGAPAPRGRGGRDLGGDGSVDLAQRLRARADGLPVRPLPFDEAFQRKPAWDAIAAAFDARPGKCSPRRC